MNEREKREIGFVIVIIMILFVIASYAYDPTMWEYPNQTHYCERYDNTLLEICEDVVKRRRNKSNRRRIKC